MRRGLLLLVLLSAPVFATGFRPLDSFNSDTLSVSLTGATNSPDSVTNSNSINPFDLTGSPSGWELSGDFSTNLPATPVGTTFSSPLDVMFTGGLTCTDAAGCGPVEADFNFSASLDSFVPSGPYTIDIIGNTFTGNATLFGNVANISFSGDFNANYAIPASGNYSFMNSGIATFSNSTILENMAIRTGTTFPDGSQLSFPAGFQINVPEPADFLLMAAGLGLLWFLRRRA